MTILDMLKNKNQNEQLIKKSLDIIKDNYTSLVNDNYEIVLNVNNELSIKIPSLQKRDEYEYRDISEYEYPLIMCMRISEKRNSDVQNYMLSKFMELYKDKLELLFKDVQTIDNLKDKIKATKTRIDYITYISIAIVIFNGILVCALSNLSGTKKVLLIVMMIGVLIFSLYEQFTKETQVKKILDGYISLIKTDWYRRVLMREYIFLCNFV